LAAASAFEWGCSLKKIEKVEKALLATVEFAKLRCCGQLLPMPGQ
jgi:hypothetical protein